MMSSSERSYDKAEAGESDRGLRVHKARVSHSRGDKESDESGKRASGDETDPVGCGSIASSGKMSSRHDVEGSYSIFVGSIPSSTSFRSGGHVEFLVHWGPSLIFSSLGHLEIIHLRLLHSLGFGTMHQRLKPSTCSMEWLSMDTC